MLFLILEIWWRSSRTKLPLAELRGDPWAPIEPFRHSPFFLIKFEESDDYFILRY